MILGMFGSRFCLVTYRRMFHSCGWVSSKGVVGTMEKNAAPIQYARRKQTGVQQEARHGKSG